ncbi:hypothetical protein ABZ752_10075 [Streptomyces roseifaciens]
MPVADADVAVAVDVAVSGGPARPATSTPGRHRPALITSSADDRIVCPHHQHELAGGIPRARVLRVLGGIGLPAENSALLAAKVAEHLDLVQSLML